MNEQAAVFGAVVVVLAGVWCAALEYPSAWHRLRGFVLAALTLAGMAAAGAGLGIVLREALKNLW